MMTDENVGASRPVLRIVSGNPSPEEIAAIVAVIGRRAPLPRTGTWNPHPWSDRARMMPSMPAPGVGAWQASYLPR